MKTGAGVGQSRSDVGDVPRYGRELDESSSMQDAMFKKPLKTELHHWWPRTLSDHWAAADGMVSAIRPSGDVQRAPAGAFGAITNAHHMKLGGPWDSTFEPIFNEADGEVGDFVRWLSTLEAPHIGADDSIIQRIAAQQLPDDRQQQIARVTASLLARSPGIRHLIKLRTEDLRDRFGFADPTADKTLIASNQRGLYEAYRRCMAGRGRWAIIFSDEREFVAGDGFLHNFPASQDGINSGLKLVIPILPTATIVYMLPGAHPTEPRLVTLRASTAEVEALNTIVQVYAKDFLFFRDHQPVLIEAFKLGQHQIYKYHGHEWLDGLLDDLSQFNLWGQGGTAGATGRRPYSERLKGERWLSTFADRGD